MAKDRTAKLLTVVVLVGALGIGAARKVGWRLSRTEPGPQDAVYSLLDAARAGDVKTYLAQCTGQMEAGVRQSVAESSAGSFAQYLRDSNAGVKGLAVAEPQISGREAAVRVEYIYQDRNEAQTIYLEKGPGGWKISRVDAGERVKTLIPYGTPVK